MKKGKASITKATNSIAGFAGRGAYKYSEVGGERCLSTKRGITSHHRSGGSAPLKVTTHIAGEMGKGALTSTEVFGGGAKMSSAHGTNGQSTDNNMNRNVGNAVGSKCRTFRKGIPGEAPSPRPHVGHVKATGEENRLARGTFGGKR